METLARFRADLMVVAAYGLILPQAVLDVPRLGCLNVHASLLPRWRGAAPIQAAIAAGDTETGITLMQMTAGLDCGPVIAQEAIDIDARETAGSLHDKLARLGGELLVAELPSVLAAGLRGVAQNDTAATYAGKIERSDARIDWRSSSIEIDRKIRAYDPVPGAWFDYRGEAIKVWSAEPVDADSAAKHDLVSACGEGMLAIESVQRPGRQRVTGRELAAQMGWRDGRLPADSGAELP